MPTWRFIILFFSLGYVFHKLSTIKSKHENKKRKKTNKKGKMLMNLWLEFFIKSFDCQISGEYILFSNI